MNIKASAPRKGCLSRNCRQLILKSDRENEQQFLAALFTAMSTGGAVVVSSLAGPTISISFPGMPTKEIQDLASSVEIKDA